MNDFGQMNYNQTSCPNNNMNQFSNFNNFANYNNPFINNNFSPMQNPNNMMMMNTMLNTSSLPYTNMMNQMDGNMQFNQINFGGFPNQMPINNNMMFNGMNNMNFMQNPMSTMQFNNNQMINNMNNITINFNNNLNNSMNNIQPGFNMNNSMENMNLNNNQNLMNNNNLYNSMNINFPNNQSNIFNFINNNFNNNFNINNINNLSNSFNNISLSEIPEDFYINKNMNNINFNTTIIPQNNIINMIFKFRTNQTFDMSGKPSDKLSKIITEFKNTKCPEKYKKENILCLHHGSKLNFEKTLHESGINNGDIILLITNDPIKENINEENKINSENNLFGQISQSGIIIKEHLHNLVYCLNNFLWKCNLCKIKYEKTSPKYFCSLCNFSMCENCYSCRNYPKKKEFPQNIDTSNITIKKKFLKTIYHKHILVYSRTSRDSTELKQWFCNNCKETFENDVWSFYCTKCDYDLCKKCAGYT